MMTTPALLTNLVIQAYDRNLDGRVDLRKGAGYEAERLLKQVQPGFDADTVTLSWVSHERLFAAADRNQDGLASREEIHTLIRFFDSDLNGEFAGDELARFQQAFPVSQGLISSARVARPGSAPDMGYSFYGVPRAIGRGSAGIQLPATN